MSGAAAAPVVCDVLVAGGGPCGLMLANELGRRGISLLLVDEKPDTAFNPQANATQARTMEHFRRLGFADEIRALGLPPDYPTDIAYFTRYAGHELARFRLPSAQAAKARARESGSSWSTPELPHRVSQKYVEAVLRRHAEALPGVSLRYGWRLEDFNDRGDGVTAMVAPAAGGAPVAVQARYLVGADGARSLVRRRLGIRYGGETGVQRDFMGGRMYALYLQAPDFYAATGHAPAWMNVAFNPERRAFMAAVDGAGEFAFHTQLQPGEDEGRLGEADALALFHATAGAAIPARILSRGSWTAGHALVADSFGRGRVLLGGDAVHLFTPTGGLGYNTAIEDAVNLGWKLAAVLHGQAAPALLDSYEAERRPLALRNTAHARAFADSLGLFRPDPAIERDDAAGAAARAQAGAYLGDHARREFNIPGITFGGRYDGSPAIIADGSTPPADAANVYVPTACPGGRPPHLWLADGGSLFDRFGFDWTLLALRDDDGAFAAAMQAAAARAGIGLVVVRPDSPAARDLYAADHVLIRPDHMVAWRGAAGDAAAILRHLLGYGAAS
ncbi:FAD-dependent oxidoreductase [Ferrovibrio sp.]|uniref:FAD-dependent oxidoreductase n=1 Tax=Ferrovibrio sp. TaxID=1917215 RepID=UPI00311F7EB1